MNNYSFIEENNITLDKCWKVAKDNQNKFIEDYYLYPNQDNFTKCEAPKPRIPETYLNHINLIGRVGVGLTDECVVDEYSKLVNNPESMTYGRCPQQLFQRIFQAGPTLKAMGDVENELELIQGNNANIYSCKKTIMEKQIYNFVPLVDCMKDIQNPDNIVPKWVNGGEDTRSYVNRQEFNKNCNR